MGSDTVLEVNQVWKKYPRTNIARRKFIRRSLVASLLNRRVEPVLHPGEFWALRNVSFELHRSESIALLGLNGSGKSTLLSLLAGLNLPDKGRIASYGKVAAFINLASGLNQSLSGFENIIFRGALNGRSRAEVLQTLDEVVDFAELGDFIDAPVSTYSSGMKMRLAFSIAVHEYPDILLVDEVLAVGDFQFKQKCLVKIQQLRENSCFVLVSHSMSDVNRFCDKAIVLDKGSVRHTGDVSGAIEAYVTQQGQQKQSKGGRIETHIERTYYDEDTVRDVQVRVLNEQGVENGSVSSDGALTVEVNFVAQRSVESLYVGVPIHTEVGEVLTAFSSEHSDLRLKLQPGEAISIRLSVPSLGLNPGSYNLIVALVDGPRFLYRAIATKLQVEPSRALYWGVYSVDAQWSVCR